MRIASLVVLEKFCDESWASRQAVLCDQSGNVRYVQPGQPLHISVPTDYLLRAYPTVRSVRASAQYAVGVWMLRRYPLSAARTPVEVGD